MKRGIIWDFDDTLVETTIFFEMSREKFACFMKEMGYPLKEVLEVLDRTDIENVKKMGGFLKECFPQAMAQTYGHFCKIEGVTPDPEICQKVAEMGWWVFEQRPEPVPGAAFVLDKLGRDFELIMATKGDPSVQWQRIEESGLKDYFSEIYVLKDKTQQEYLHIAGVHGFYPKTSWIVGNSIKSEINPGLAAGYNCIFIPNKYTWHFEIEEPEGDYVTLSSIKNIPDYIQNIGLAV